MLEAANQRGAVSFLAPFPSLLLISRRSLITFIFLSPQVFSRIAFTSTPLVLCGHSAQMDATASYMAPPMDRSPCPGPLHPFSVSDSFNASTYKVKKGICKLDHKIPNFELLFLRVCVCVMCSGKKGQVGKIGIEQEHPKPFNYSCDIAHFRKNLISFFSLQFVYPHLSRCVSIGRHISTTTATTQNTQTW